MALYQWGGFAQLLLQPLLLGFLQLRAGRGIIEQLGVQNQTEDSAHLRRQKKDEMVVCLYRYTCSTACEFQIVNQWRIILLQLLTHGSSHGCSEHVSRALEWSGCNGLNYLFMWVDICTVLWMHMGLGPHKPWAEVMLSVRRFLRGQKKPVAWIKHYHH